jgi:uncharacterized membrane protein YciS (DUF1049 family)
MKLLRNLLTLIVILAMIALGVLFSLQNKSPVPLDLLVYAFEPQSLALWILLAFALGGLVGMLVSSLMILRTRASLTATRRQLDRAREQLGKQQAEQSA